MNNHITETSKNVAIQAKRNQLKALNRDYTECLAKEYIPRWLGGEQLNVQDFCQQEYSKMISLDREIFGDLPEFH